jgi:hypothetical protein
LTPRSRVGECDVKKTKRNANKPRTSKSLVINKGEDIRGQKRKTIKRKGKRLALARRCRRCSSQCVFGWKIEEGYINSVPFSDSVSAFTVNKKGSTPISAMRKKVNEADWRRYNLGV